MAKSKGNSLEYITLDDWVKQLEEKQAELSLPRARKSFLAEKGKKPKFHKGKYGSKYDSWTCGNCGSTLHNGVCNNYCSNCGYKVLWDNPRCLTDHKEYVYD